MGLGFLFFLAVAFILIGYYLYVLYTTLKHKRKYNKSADAADLYGRTRLLSRLFFGPSYNKRENETYQYKILKDRTDENEKSL